MAHIHRLIISLVALFLSSAAFAFISPDIAEKYHWVVNSKVFFDTPEDACSAFGSSKGGTGQYFSDKSCLARPSMTTTLIIFFSVPSCPANSTVYGASCVCNSGFKEDGGQCVPDLACPVGMEKYLDVCVPACPQFTTRVNGQCIPNNTCPGGNCSAVCGYGRKLVDGICVYDHRSVCFDFSAAGTLPGGLLVQDIALKGNVSHGSKFCIPLDPELGGSPGMGCAVDFDRKMLATNHDGSQTSYGGYNISQNKSAPAGVKDYTCSVDDPDVKPKPDAPKCPAGAPGMVNGVEVCVPRSTNTGVETGGKDSSIVDDGINTTKKENDSTTVCKDGKCTTTTVTTTTVTNNASGNAATSSTTATTTTDKGEFCSKNPTNAQCNGTGSGSGGKGDGEEEEPSQFGGSCASGFTCEGDAIQCAIAKEQHIRNCKFYDTENPHALYKAALDGTDDKGADKLREQAVQLSVSSLDSTGLGWSRACPADPSFEVAGKSFVIPFHKVCPPLSVLSYAAVALTLLGSLLWVVGTGIKA